MQKSGILLRVLSSNQPGLQGCFRISGRCLFSVAAEAKNKPVGVMDIPGVSVGPDKVKASFAPPRINVPITSGVKVDAVPPIVELTREIRHRAWNAGFLDMNDVRENAMTFIAGLRYVFAPAQKSPDVDHAITLTNVGNTSFATRLTTLLPADQGELDVTNVMYWVHVDKNTRKAIPLPEWFKKKYLFAAQKSDTDKISPLRLPRYQKPTWLLRTITRDEIDKFGHTNYEHYIRFAIESLRDNLEHPGNQPRNGEPITDLLAESVSSIDILFSGETRLGDEIQICSWLCQDKPEVAHAMVYKHGRPIVHATFTFNKPAKPKAKI